MKVSILTWRGSGTSAPIQGSGRSTAASTVSFPSSGAARATSTIHANSAARNFRRAGMTKTVRTLSDTLPEDFFSSDYYADKMIAYLSEQADDAPFFAYLAFTAPHDPFKLPDAWLDQISRAPMTSGYDVDP